MSQLRAPTFEEFISALSTTGLRIHTYPDENYFTCTLTTEDGVGYTSRYEGREMHEFMVSGRKTIARFMEIASKHFILEFDLVGRVLRTSVGAQDHRVRDCRKGTFDGYVVEQGLRSLMSEPEPLYLIKLGDKYLAFDNHLEGEIKWIDASEDSSMRAVFPKELVDIELNGIRERSAKAGETVVPRKVRVKLLER